MSLKLTDNSVLPFVFLVAMIYSIFYIFFNSILDNGTPFMPHNKTDISLNTSNRNVVSSIDPMGSKDFISKDSLVISTTVNGRTTFTGMADANQFPGWFSLKKEMTPQEVITLVGEPTRKEKGLTEIWYYNEMNNQTGSVLFYDNRLVSYNIPGNSRRRLN